MTVAELIIQEKEQSIQRYYSCAAQDDKLKSAADIKKLKLFAEQLYSGTAYTTPLKKHSRITNDAVLRYTRGNYKYSYAGAGNNTLSAVATGLLFETKHGLFFYIFKKDKVVKIPSSMIKNVPEHKWVAIQRISPAETELNVNALKRYD